LMVGVVKYELKLVGTSLEKLKSMLLAAYLDKYRVVFCSTEYFTS